MSKSHTPKRPARAAGGGQSKPRAAAEARTPARSPERSGRRPFDPTLVGVLLLASLCAGLVAANNAGVLPDGVKRHLGGPTAVAPLGAATAPPTPLTTPKPAKATPAPATAPKPEPEPTNEPQPTSEPAEPVPAPQPREAEPAATPPAAKAATPVKGRLDPDQRRARLSHVTPPPGFTSEWRGGPAVLNVDANEIVRGGTGAKRVALTFDGCFINAPVARMLEILRNEHLHATFFLTGMFCRKYPDTVRQIAAGGHEIANHSDTHPDFTKLDDAAGLAQLEKAEALLVKLAGEAYRPFFRPPLGARNVRTLRNALRHGFLPIYWTVDTLDWQPTATADSVLAKLKAKGLKPGAIFLQHAGSAATLEALPRELALLREEGLEPGPLSALLRP